MNKITTKDVSDNFKNERLNYWLLTSEYPPFFGGGIGTYCVTTARMLAGKGHRVSVFVQDASVNDIDITETDQIRVIRFNTSRTKSSAFLGHTTNISYEFAHIIKHFIEKEGKPDIIEAQEYLGIAYYLLQFKRLQYDWCKDVPIVITMHSPSFLYMEYNHVSMYRYPNYWICEMERFCLQAADFIVSPSNYIISELSSRFTLSHDRIEVIPNPFENELNSFLPQTTQQNGEIVFFGKLTAQKGAFKLLKYFETLWNRGFDRPLYLLGGQDIIYHPEKMSMGDIIKKKYKEYIDKGLLKMEKGIPPQKISERLSKAEVVIIPSNNDNLPYVVFEMMALGKTVLVSKQGGQAEVVEDGKNGFIFDHEKPDSFFQQLSKILGLSPAAQQDISRSAAETITERYRPSVIYDKKIKLIERLLANARDNRVFPYVRPQVEQKKIAKDSSEISNRLTVVIPYHNLGAYIEQTISSLMAVKYPDLEILIVNDGSTERKSIDILEILRKKFSIKVIDVAVNEGLGKARNLGAQQASGEYLAFLDADDMVRDDYYAKAINVFRQYDNVHFAGSWVKYFENSTDTWPAFQPEAPLILYHNLVNSSALVYKRSSFLAAGLNDTKATFSGLEDYDSVISMVEQGLGGVIFPEALFNYRVRSNSMYREISKAKKLHLSEHIAQRHKQFYATFAADTFSLLNANGPGIYLDNPTLDYHLAEQLPFGGKLAQKAISLIKRNELVKTTAYKIFRMLKK